MRVDRQADARAVLDFWFLPVGSEGHGSARREWFRKDDQFDEQIRARFGGLIELALAGGLQAWVDVGVSAAAAGRVAEGDAGTGADADADADPALAYIVLLDQFTRNVHRGTPRAFAGDAQALSAARRLVASGADLKMAPQQRTFVYMPFEHAEDRDTQRQSVALFTRLAADAAGVDNVAGSLDFAHRHCVIIERFGRFPHRNQILGRVSTPEELAFLQQPGSGF